MKSYPTRGADLRAHDGRRLGGSGYAGLRQPSAQESGKRRAPTDGQSNGLPAPRREVRTFHGPSVGGPSDSTDNPRASAGSRYQTPRERRRLPAGPSSATGLGRPGPDRRDLTQPQEGAYAELGSAPGMRITGGGLSPSAAWGRHGFDVGERAELTHGSGACAAQNNAGNLDTCGHHASGGSTAEDGGLTSSSRATPMVRELSNRRTLGETGTRAPSQASTGLGACPDYAGGSRRTAKGNRATRADSGEVMSFGGRGFDSRRLHSRVGQRAQRCLARPQRSGHGTAPRGTEPFGRDSRPASLYQRARP